MTDDIQRWVWAPTGMEPYRAHPLMPDVGGVFVRAEDATSVYNGRTAQEWSHDYCQAVLGEANLFFCPQGHAIYVDGGCKTDDDIPCPYCERDKLQEDKYALIEDFNEVQLKVSGLKQQNARLRAALEKAGQAIHSEYCGSEHHAECRKVTDALMQSQEPS